MKKIQNSQTERDTETEIDIDRYRNTQTHILVCKYTHMYVLYTYIIH